LAWLSFTHLRDFSYVGCIIVLLLLLFPANRFIDVVGNGPCEKRLGWMEFIKASVNGNHSIQTLIWLIDQMAVRILCFFAHSRTTHSKGFDCSIASSCIDSLVKWGITNGSIALYINQIEDITYFFKKYIFIAIREVNWKIWCTTLLAGGTHPSE
jgi:hypothetical protein